MPEPTMPTPAIHVLIPCGGTGSRAGAGAPKQYRLLAGQPMVVHTLAAFAQVRGIDLLLCVVAPDDGIFETLLPATQLVAKKAGLTRGETVLNGLNYLLTQGARLHDWVLVHDAARCLITPAQITQL
ncbi:MAG: hypothetical protein RLZZ401_2168, partial [Pseudomonadota bacterium]